MIKQMSGLLGLAFILSIASCVSLGTYKNKLRENHALKQENQAVKNQIAELDQQKKDQEEAQSEQISSIRKTYDDLITELKDEMSDGSVGVSTSGEELTISMGNKVLFRSGQSELQKKGKKILTNVADVIRDLEGQKIRVEGHTDNIKIKGKLKKKYPSNWDLSAARASAVVRFLIKNGLPPSSFVLVAHADQKPLVSNETLKGRRQNRRVEISLIQQDHF